ncbi:MAG: DUF1648 domain-containing protein [Prevotella sp.]|nr:DUF1648 domain-containing protein [Prevotella sp.]
MRISFFRKSNNANAPEIIVHRTKEGTLFEIIAAVLVVIMWGIIIATYADLPDNIGTHYDLCGHVNRTGNKIELIALGIVGTLTVAFMMAVCYSPKLINLKIKSPTVEHYKLAIRMMRVMGVEMAALFVFIVLQMSGICPPDGKLMSIVPVIIVIVWLATVLIFIILLRRIR